MKPRWLTWAPPLLAAAIGLGVFLAQGGAVPLDVRSLAWIPSSSDWSEHVIGWLFFRHAPWQLPLGAIPTLIHPVGTTIGFTDSIPWMALLAKLSSRVLPETFQYVGVWLALCYGLQGWFGARLLQALGGSPVTATLGGALFTLSPVLAHRVNHEALCAHFLLLAAITLNVRRAPRPPRVAPVLLVVVAAGVHPYLCLMVTMLVVAAIVRAWYVDRLFSAREAVGQLTAVVGATVLVLAVFGYFSNRLEELGGQGFSYFSSDLATFLNPRGYSRFLPSLPLWSGKQDEGFGYLGLGVLALGSSALVLCAIALRRRSPRLPWRALGPLFVAIGLLTLCAVSLRLTAGGKELVYLGALDRALAPMTAPFRSSGRFIWPLHYLLVAGAISIWMVRQPRWAPWVLAACLALQTTDLSRILLRSRFHAGRERPPSPAWALARGELSHVVLVPPECGDGPPCGPGAEPPGPSARADRPLAASLRMTFNSGRVARAPKARYGPYVTAFLRDVRAGRLDPATIYVVPSAAFQRQFRAANPDAICGDLDDLLVCVSAAAGGRFKAYLTANP